MLHGKAASVKVCEIPGSKDLAEAIGKGVPVDELRALFDEAPMWTPPNAADARAILDDVHAFVRRFVALSEAQARVIALWILHTHFIDAADYTPYLSITSAEKQCGKSRLLEICELLVARPWRTERASAAVLPRRIEAERPTLLLDETDAAFSGDKEYSETLRGILNSGHRRGGKTSLCVGSSGSITYKDFGTFCAKAIAGIGKLPDTVADRSIPVRLKRRLASEGIERFRRREVEPQASALREHIEALAVRETDNLRSATPELPDELTDRQQDGAEPLLSIADLAGGEWPNAARAALIELCTEARCDDQSIGVRLLADIRAIFEGRDEERIASKDLAGALADIETSPWPEYNGGNPLTAAKLARLLARYQITPGTKRIGDRTAKGYESADFQEAFARYLPSDRNGIENVTKVTTSQNIERKPNKNGACDLVTLYPPPTGANGVSETSDGSTACPPVPGDAPKKVTTSQAAKNGPFLRKIRYLLPNVTVSKARQNQTLPKPVQCQQCGEWLMDALARTEHVCASVPAPTVEPVTSVFA